MFTAFKYRIYPNSNQKVLIAKHFGCARWVYNWGLAKKTVAWSTERKHLSRYDLSKEIPLLKNNPDTEWLSEVNAQSLQASLANLDSAYVKFFRDKKGFPKFKNKYSHQSFQCPQRGEIDFVNNTISTPKIPNIKAKLSRKFEGTIKTVTISKTVTNKYFASILVDTGIEPKPLQNATFEGTVGIDLGLKHFAILSTGEKIENPRNFRNAQRKLRRHQRQLAKSVKGSQNRIKKKYRVALIHEKIANKRKDFLHKLTTRLVRDNQTDSFAIEDLAVKNMVRNHCLSKAINDVGWGMFRTFLTYKAAKEGKNLIVINRFWPSSKMCSCGVINYKLSLEDREWTCSACGVTHDRDILAANNIKRMALHPQNFLGRDAPKPTLAES